MKTLAEIMGINKLIPILIWKSKEERKAKTT